MATDEHQNDETEVPAPEVDAASVTGETDDSGTAPADTPTSDSSETQDVPPEHQTPVAGGSDLAVPSAAGSTEPPTDAGNAGGGVAASAADEASPTGGANTAGTPASQLDLAPPMADESGSNIPAPNLRQPVLEGALPAGTPASVESLDPALVNPDEVAKARVEGRTSDAATRAEGTHIDEVPSDLNAGVKPSDAGPEAYPFPQGGDVEVATVPKGDGAGEYWPSLEVEDYIVLGEHELVPERLVGRRASVVSAPRYLIPVGSEDQVWITVRTRDEVNATLTIPLSAAASIEKGGRSTTVRG